MKIKIINEFKMFSYEQLNLLLVIKVAYHFEIILDYKLMIYFAT